MTDKSVKYIFKNIIQGFFESNYIMEEVKSMLDTVVQCTVVT